MLICKMFKIVGILIGFFLLYVGGVLLYGMFIDWQLEGNIDLELDVINVFIIILDLVILLVIWNIGYFGLGEEFDFFYDNGGFFFLGGYMICFMEDLVIKNCDGVILFMESIQVDFFFFQEVDIDFKCFYYVNQMEVFQVKVFEFVVNYVFNYCVQCVLIFVLEFW